MSIYVHSLSVDSKLCWTNKPDQPFVVTSVNPDKVWFRFEDDGTTFYNYGYQDMVLLEEPFI